MYTSTHLCFPYWGPSLCFSLGAGAAADLKHGPLINSALATGRIEPDNKVVAHSLVFLPSPCSVHLSTWSRANSECPCVHTKPSAILHSWLSRVFVAVCPSSPIHYQYDLDLSTETHCTSFFLRTRNIETPLFALTLLNLRAVYNKLFLPQQSFNFCE